MEFETIAKVLCTRWRSWYCTPCCKLPLLVTKPSAINNSNLWQCVRLLHDRPKTFQQVITNVFAHKNVQRPILFPWSSFFQTIFFIISDSLMIAYWLRFDVKDILNGFNSIQYSWIKQQNISAYKVKQFTSDKVAPLCFLTSGVNLDPCQFAMEKKNCWWASRKWKLQALLASGTFEYDHKLLVLSFSKLAWMWRASTTTGWWV